MTNATGATISGGINGIDVVNGAGIVTNAGTISGGTNSVRFTGTDTHTLILQTGSVLIGDAVGSTLAGATNKLILQGSGTVDNHFTGFNTLDVNASGAWVWNSNSAIDATTVNSGTLVVDNVLASPVTVNSGGTLAGQGLISGDISVASGGMVAPGAAVPFSTLNVSGNVSFQPGSIFRVNADATGKNDKLAVTGSATLTGGTVNVLAGGSFALVPGHVQDIDHDQRQWSGRHHVQQCHHQSGLSHAVAQLYRERCNPDAGNGNGRHR